MQRFALILIAALCGTAHAQSTRPALDANTVLILPLTPVGEAAKLDWIGQAVQQNLATEATKVPGQQALGPATQPIAAGDLDAAKAAARSAGAGKVVFGSFQMVENELRLTGQMYDLVKGEYIGSLKATGPLRDLFALEDTLAGQLRKMLAPPRREAPAAPPPVVAPRGPVEARPDADAGWERYNAYRYDPGYSYYNWTYPSPYYCSPYRYWYQPPSGAWGGWGGTIIIYPPGSNPPPRDKGRPRQPW